MNDTTPDAPWYRNGLKFTCTRCGNCCTGDTGTVRVSDDEIEALATLLEIDRDEFRALYVRKLRGGELSLVEKRNYDCIFWDRNTGCTVYAASDAIYDSAARCCPALSERRDRTFDSRRRHPSDRRCRSWGQCRWLTPRCRLCVSDALERAF